MQRRVPLQFTQGVELFAGGGNQRGDVVFDQRLLLAIQRVAQPLQRISRREVHPRSC
ncbi:hypothetical protein D3C71_1092640 [compost metagenome]